MSRFKQWQNPRTGQWVKYDRQKGKIVDTADEKFNLEQVPPPESESKEDQGGTKEKSDTDSGFTFF